MVKVKNIIPAMRAIIDRDSNKLSLIDVLENSLASNFPYAYSNITYAVFMERTSKDPEEGELEISLRVGKKFVLEKAKAKYNFEGRNHAKCLMNITGVGVENPGVIEFTVIANKVETKHSITVEAMPKTN